MSQRLQKHTKKAHERYQSLSKEEKEKKNNNMVVNNINIYQNMKRKSLLSIKYMKCEQTPYHNFFIKL